MTTISAIATKNKVFDVIESGVELYQYTVTAMDAIQAVKNGLSGASKKEWVLAFVRSLAYSNGLGSLWEKLIDAISKFIDKVKTLFNKETKK